MSLRKTDLAPSVSQVFVQLRCVPCRPTAAEFTVISKPRFKINKSLNDKIPDEFHRLYQGILYNDNSESSVISDKTRCSHTYLLTYSMVQSPSWEANWFAASQEIPRISRNPNVHYRTHKRLPPVSILGQPNPVHIPTSWRPILILSTHLRLGLPSGLLPSGFPTKTLYTALSSPIRATFPAHCLYNILTHYLISATTFGGKVTERKMCVWILSTTFVINISHSKKKWARYDQNVHTSSCKVPVIIARFQWNFYFLERFSKNTQTSNFMKIRLVGAELCHADGRIDGQTWGS